MQSKNPFDQGILKNFQDFKNKNASLSLYPSYIKKAQNAKMIIANGIKFGANKKVITGNLLNMNTNDVSTNSSIRSKIDQNTNTNKEPAKIDVNNNINHNNKEKQQHEFLYQIPIKYENNKEKEETLPSRLNCLKEKDSKKEVDFRMITTSPVIRVIFIY
jgi:hypothetical protein